MATVGDVVDWLLALLLLLLPGLAGGVLRIHGARLRVRPALRRVRLGCGRAMVRGDV